MEENEKQAKAIAKRRDIYGYRSSGKITEEERPASRYTFFILGLVSLIAGSWAVTCFVKAASENGPLDLVRKLTSALLGK